MEPLFLTDLIRGLGFGQQIVVAATVGLGVWYTYRAMGVGHLIGGIIGQGARYGLALGAFGAVGIAAGWIDFGAVATDLGLLVDQAGELVDRYADDVVRWIEGALQ